MDSKLEKKKKREAEVWRMAHHLQVRNADVEVIIQFTLPRNSHICYVQCPKVPLKQQQKNNNRKLYTKYTTKLFFKAADRP